MYLFKCSCGCIFTTKTFDREVECQGCLKQVMPSQNKDRMIEELTRANWKMQIIPDNAKIEVTFTP